MRRIRWNYDTAFLSSAITTQHGAIQDKAQTTPTNIFKEYIIKDFVMDDERLKQGKTLPMVVFPGLMPRLPKTTWMKSKYIS